MLDVEVDAVGDGDGSAVAGDFELADGDTVPVFFARDQGVGRVSADGEARDVAGDRRGRPAGLLQDGSVLREDHVAAALLEAPLCVVVVSRNGATFADGGAVAEVHHFGDDPVGRRAAISDVDVAAGDDPVDGGVVPEVDVAVAGGHGAADIRVVPDVR
eukprot:CAMPEP_0118919890 /NCGR_PEP_ID=MMETSP1166-20130328/18790_1 /TAXON_ID=1104430 /ORGANISM="Chrysoreinhardia sp, Strain CCMP3193" /LENGTH=158 /DNA_ID=CAMNT_0006860425 /DNA_START=578 /DNA_END=1051 /DNA_ORIENTATION=+